MRSIEEEYVSATNATDLRVKAEKRGPADVLIASGWSGSRIGSAILRLCSEWDGSARRLASKTDQVLLAGQLKSLPTVRRELVLHTQKMDISDNVALSVLLWWLNRVCRTCHGQQRQVIPGTPVLSDLVCPSCQGSGHAEVPHGQTGRQVAGMIDDAVNAALVKIKQRMRN